MPDTETATLPKPPTPVMDWADVQGDILQPYADNFATHLFIVFADAGNGCRAIQSLRGLLATADKWADQADHHCNFGLTFNGLTALGLPAAELNSFPYPFQVGMAGRALILGDTGASAPNQWEPPFAMPVIHALVMVSGTTALARDMALAEVNVILTTCNAAVVHTEAAATLSGTGNQTKEHFGFNDGIGQPAVAGAPGPSWPGQGTPMPDGTWQDLALGAFLLGHPNELGTDAPFPANPVLRTNSTFMVYRKLEQHVALFRSYIADNQHLVGGDGDLLAAKLVGRWRSGAPLALSPDHDDPELGSDDARNDNFRYADDVDGMKVPHLSHIRRANPRDSLPADSRILPRLHRIIRRKMPYGPWLPEGAPDDGTPRGVLFRVYNADIVSQFEMVQSQWMASGNQAGGLSTDQDVIAGLTDPPDTGDNRLGSTFAIPRCDGIKTLYGLPRFVTMRGGEYFFVPGMKALDWIVANSADGAGDSA